MRLVLRTAAAAALALSAAGPAGCGDGSGPGAAGDDSRPLVVASTSVLADIVEQVVGDAAAVEVAVPAGADPHEFAASARQAERLAEADLLVVAGAGFEHGLEAAVEAAEDAGVEVFALAEHVDLLDGDPHVWLDPLRTRDAVLALGEALAGAGIDAAGGAERFAAELEAVHEELAAVLAEVPPARRVFVANHDVLGYLADRYGFEVAGTVHPGTSTHAEASTAHAEELVELLDETGVPAVFTDSSTSADLARSLAGAAAGDVEVVELFTESLGPEGSGADTYLGLLRTNAERIRDALA